MANLYNPVPHLDEEELAEILERAVPHACGCLILPPKHEGGNPAVIKHRGRRVSMLRLIWAENEGDAGLEDHEVTHIPECPHTGGINGSIPFCIEPSHLRLSNPQERINAMMERKQGGTLCAV